jgi:hypothetical protein
VDVFLELVAERLEELVRDNVHLRDRVDALQRTVDSQSGREHAVQEALVTAQELRSDIKGAAQREADLILQEAKSEARSLVAEADAEIRNRLRDAERRLEAGRDTMEELERRRSRFLKHFRQLLERELEDLVVEEGKEPVDQRPIELDLGRPKGMTREVPVTPAPVEGTSPSSAEAGGDGAEEGTQTPPLDRPVDELAAGYRAEAEHLFGDGTKGGAEEEADLFTLPEADNDEEDSRWG